MAATTETDTQSGTTADEAEETSDSPMLIIESDPVPLTLDAEGRVRVAGTRVTLDTVVEAFDQGATPEEIVEEYPTLQRADVYAVIGYYLRHWNAVRTYLRAQDEEAEQVRREAEARYNLAGLKERLRTQRPARRS